MKIRKKKPGRLQESIRSQVIMIFQNMKEEIKQIMQVKAQKERRFDTRDKFSKQSKIFQTDAKRFY